MNSVFLNRLNKSTLLLKGLALSVLLASSAFAAEKVNINTADAATLDRVLDGIGPSKAEAIVAYRKQNGGFRSVDQLASVKGIGLSTIEKNKDRIVISGGTAVTKTTGTKTVAKTSGVKQTSASTKKSNGAK